ncbi:Long-chain-fatty-acid--CoA ligase [Roseovarius sp. THAF9]|uniref:class I adenylate-forming enzyme family protein n=1 Tax=Roseovarius sp. THAF9 TaxID=2587847 RepID=UPI001267ADB0|nr:AMP-binding protein [Roseovarius sp. THAF9]QFT92502.1 Long-chain-fatty-acid--CoA ligase [Roseovarius sp. THAF9]
MNIAHWLQSQAQAGGTKPALFHGTRSIADYAGFHARAAAFAGGLASRGIRPGDRVALFMANHPDYLVALFGIWIAGAVAVPVNARLHGQEAAWILDNAEASLCIATGAQAEALAGALATAACPVASPDEITGDALPLVPRAPSDLAWLFYTSGTTGRPKGVQITHRMLQTMSLGYLASVDAVSAEDVTLYAAPMSHGAGLYSFVHVLMGARHVVPESGGVDPGEILDLASHYGRMHMFAAPTMVRRLTDYARDHDRDGTGLRSVVYGGGPMYVSDIEAALDVFGPVFIQIYGQGEAPMAITSLSREDVSARRALATVGRAQAGVELRVGDAAGHPLPLGEVGEIMVRGDLVMPGYWRNAAATAETLRDGWLLTGDTGCLDKAGYLTLQDRSKDVIISGGQNVYPREVEEALLSHGSVSEVAVVGRKSAAWGEEVVAFVVLKDGALDEPALDAHCLNRIARFKRPKAYVAVNELPKNNYGKVVKTALRERLAQD